MKEKSMPSLFEIEEGFVIDLDKITYINREYIRMMGAIHLRVSRENHDKVLKAWIAYKGKFDPAKER